LSQKRQAEDEELECGEEYFHEEQTTWS
jgi:hypothetical protein